MASTSLVTKQLGDLLQEQQEPFTLEIYLIERGYSKNKFNLELYTSSKFLKNKKIIPICSKAVRALFNKLGYLNPRIKDSGTKKRKKNSQEITEDNTFSSASSKNSFNSCSESDTEDRYILPRKGSQRNGNLLGEEEVDTDIKRQRRILEDNMQHSPVSVLEETEFNENSPIHKRGQSLKTRHEEIPSDSIFLDSCKFIEPLKIKLALQQTKQLLFDCVKEIVETRRLKGISQQQFKEFLGAEEIGKVVCENICEWSKQSMHVTNTKQLLDLDLLASAEEWSYFELQRKGIGMEIAAAILEDISCEIVMDMV